MPVRSADEATALLRAEERLKTRRTPGAIFRRSELGRKIAARGFPPNGAGSVPVTDSAEELIDFIRARSMTDVLSALELMPDAPRIVQTRPTPAALLPLCTLVPTTTTQIPTVTETFQIEDAAYAPDGTNLPGVSGPDIAGFEVNYLEAVRVGRVIPAPLPVLEDAGQAEAIIDKLITQNWQRAMEGYVLTGTPANLVGITQTAGVPPVDSSAQIPSDAIASAVSAIQTAGFYGPHTVVASPATLKAIWLEKDGDGNYIHWPLALPTIGAWVPAPSLPFGTAVVGDFSEALVYLFSTFNISISQGVADYFARNLAAVKGEQRAAVWIRNPPAFNIVDHLAGT